MTLLLSQLRLMMSQHLPCQRRHGCGYGHSKDNPEKQLLTSDQVPSVMQEPFIYTGYRPLNKPYMYYVWSLFALHNESLNVWTHSVGFLLVLLSLFRYLARPEIWAAQQVYPMLVFGVCQLTMLALSSIAHLFHSKSSWHHYAFYLLDYVGVTLHAFGSGVGSMFLCSSPNFHRAAVTWFLPVNVFFSWFAFYACCVAKIKLQHNNSQRKYVMVAGVLCTALIAAVPTASRYLDCVVPPEHPAGCTLWSLNHLTIVFLLLILCALTFAAHVPESLYPGSFDICGHGHQVFHICVVVAMLAQVWAIDIDVTVLNAPAKLQTQATPLQLAMSLLGLLLLEGLTLTYYMKQVVFRKLSADASACAAAPVVARTDFSVGDHVTNEICKKDL